MAETYAYFPVWKAGSLEAVNLEEAAHEWEVALKEANGVSLRGAYGCEGLRPDADLMMWWVAESPEAVHDLARRLRATVLGKRLTLSWAFLGVHRPPEFNPQHVPAFLRGEEPRRYLCVYPFVRTPEWYLLPAERRAELLREHGEIGREYPDVLPNTTSAFGLGDWEWILAFEADDLHRLVDCIRRLRESESRRYVKEETPFITGIRKDLPQALLDLG